MNNPPSWEAPIPLGVFLPPKFPEDIFNDDIQRFICELSQSTETPIELASLNVLAVVATAAQGKFKVQIKEDYYEPINVWTSVALPSGSRKSAVLSKAVEPLIEWEKKQKDVIEPLMKEAIATNKTIEIKLKEMRKQAANASDEEFDSLNESILEFENSIKKVPIVPQIWTADITPENLSVIMADNQEKMSVISDEAGIFDILNGRYSNGIPNLDIFLQGHAGSAVRVNRNNRPPLFLEHATLTIGLAPQPELLQGITNNKTFRGRGLLGRFLYALPFSNLGSRSLDSEPMSKDVIEQYSNIITKILEIEVDEPYFIKLSESAYDKWLLYSKAIEIRMGDDGPYVHMRDWAGKLAGAIARVAALIHIADNIEGEPYLIPIHEDTMKKAIKLGHILSEHAQAVFDLMGADSDLEGARLIFKWFKSKGLLEFTVRDCHYAHKSRFKKAKELEGAINVLKEMHYIHELEGAKKIGRPSRKMVVNPMIYEEKT